MCKISGLCNKEDILSLHVPNTRECIGFYPYSALSQGTYLTNKYNHFKKTGG